jgi:flagellar motility protein MotE (MotC chaperone)
MIRLVRDIRLIPVVLIATIALFALKSLGLVFDGGYLLGAPPGKADDIDVTGAITPKRATPPTDQRPAAAQTAAKQSWAQEMFNYPDITGSVDAAKPAPPEAGATKGNRAGPKDAPPAPGGTVVSLERSTSPAERAILERLQERRTELDARARDLEMRESLLKAAEKRVEGRVAELKDLEARVNNAVRMKEEGEAARFKNLITMYDNMKAKDAAKIFDRLDIKVLVEVATQLNPRRMSDILAQMTPEAAERITTELATRVKDKANPADLPKIEGRPTAN